MAVNFKNIAKMMQVKLKGKTASFMRKLKHCISKNKPPRMTADEKRLAREMHFDRGLTQTEVSSALGRDLSCINRLLAQKKAPKPMGRPVALAQEQVDKIEAVLNKLIDKAEGTYEVSMDMLMKSCRRPKSADGLLGIFKTLFAIS